MIHKFCKRILHEVLEKRQLKFIPASFLLCDVGKYKLNDHTCDGRNYFENSR